jgi:hypothetical protein
MKYQGEEKIEMPGEEKVDSFDMGEKKVEEATSTIAHAHFAGRVPAGLDLPVCISKNGVNHVSYRVKSCCSVFVLHILSMQSFMHLIPIHPFFFFKGH